MTVSENIYRKIAHDFLNITSRLESASSLLSHEEPPTEDDVAMINKIFGEGSKKLGEAVQLFCWWQWLENTPDLVLTEVDPGLILQEEIAALSETSQHRIVFENNIPHTTELITDKSLVQMFLRQLIKNATQHNKPDTPIYIHLNIHKNRCVVKIQNTANTALPQNFQKPLVRASHSHGLGFGMSLLHSAVPFLKAELDFKENGEQIEATVSFPLANSKDAK